MNERVEGRSSIVTEIGPMETELENNLECGKITTTHYNTKSIRREK